MLRFAVASSAVLALVVLCVVPPPSCASDLVEYTPEAYVSLLYGNTYTLPIRVMMKSLLINSPDSRQVRDRVVLQTAHTSEANIKLLESDGIRVIRVPPVDTPYSRSPKFHHRFSHVMTKLAIFNLTQYQRVLFIDADSMVLQDLSPLFSCARLCATFLNPCYFNAGFMLVTPNATLYRHMVSVLPHTPSYDGGDQGFLNSYYPQMARAPLFRLGKSMVNESFGRFPFSFHTDHSSYYNRLSFTFEKNPVCGPARDVEWLGPPFMKPWIWWGYAVFDLSWAWYKYRRQLETDLVTHMRMNAFAVISALVAYVWLSNLFVTFESSPWTGKALKAISRLPFPRFLPRTNSFYLSMMGFVSWLVTVIISVRLVPTTTPPLQAFFSFAHVRALCTSSVLLLIGALCLAQTPSTLSDSRLKNLKADFAKYVKRIVIWSCADAVYLVVWIFIMWNIKFSSIWGRAVFLVIVVASQLLLTLMMLVDITKTCTRAVQDIDSVHKTLS